MGERYSTYPVFLLLEGKPVLVVGGGEVALRKVQGLLQSKADVTVVAPGFCKGIEELGRQDRIRLIKRPVVDEDLDGMALVVAGTSDGDVNYLVFEAARERGILINVVDEPKLCDFFVPSQIHRGDLTIAISTSGSAPGLSKYFRKDISSSLSPELGIFVDLIKTAREKIREMFPGDDQAQKRKDMLEAVLNSQVRRLVEQGSLKEAGNLVDRIICN
ncbi:MAG: bifunctional precorrin-2 dehydrogenase/sirohydrochlorin ferrochelatase [Deltaproteobacteria bacterium]|nr:bifunctional precorrin-2 dehydrogenase/sirohydrochlorin ferrochelatase [Deltaproteobacteria bacterium]